MAEFLNPFTGLTPNRKLTVRELSRAIRGALSAEEEAIHFYEALADATDNSPAREVLQSVAEEERVHAGEFQRLLNLLLPDEAVRLAEGAAEVDEISNNLKIPQAEAGENANKNQLTVGSLKT
ncbi:MAG: ferritin family protein [Kiritimatiellia bacterium]